MALNKQLDASAKPLCLHMAQLLHMANLYLGLMVRTYSRNEPEPLITLVKWSSHDDVRKKPSNLDRRLV